MAISFPTGIDELTNPTSTNTLAEVDHATQHANANDILEALEAKVGITESTVETSHDKRISVLESSAHAAHSDDQTLPVKASIAEINAGVDEDKFFTSDEFAGSNFGVRYISQIALGADTSLTVADGVGMDMIIPPALNGMNLVYAQAYVDTAGTTNATTIQIHNVTDNTDMLSTNISIASAGRVGTAGTVNASYDDVATNDLIRIDTDAISTTAPKGLTVVLGFSLP